MDWLAIVQLIIAILTTLLEVLGGGSPLIPSQVVYQLNDNQWVCEQPYWAFPATVKDRKFTGTVAMDCDVEGLSGGGLKELHEHLLGRVPDAASQIHEGPLPGYVGWLPSTFYNVSYEVDDGEEITHIRGDLNIASDGYSELKNSFRSSDISDDGSSRYLRKFNEEYQVIPTQQEGWYRLHITYGSQIEKPGYISDDKFKEEVVRKLEQRMEERKEKILNDLAPHL